MNDTFVFNPIGIVRSCFTEKFRHPPAAAPGTGRPCHNGNSVAV
jgi:hypothetical protein